MRPDDKGFVECAACAAKPGSPTLCDSCVHNRHVIHHLSWMLDSLKRDSIAQWRDSLEWQRREALRRRHMPPFMIIDEAADVPDDVFQQLSVRFKAEPADHLRMRMEGRFEEMDDGKPLNFIKHPQRTPWWKRILTMFKRPKLTESNLEPAEDLKL